MNVQQHFIVSDFVFSPPDCRIQHFMGPQIFDEVGDTVK